MCHARKLKFSSYVHFPYKQEIVFKKDKATLHVISKIYEDTVIIPIKLEGNPLTLRYADE